MGGGGGAAGIESLLDPKERFFVFATRALCEGWYKCAKLAVRGAGGPGHEHAQPRVRLQQYNLTTTNHI